MTHFAIKHILAIAVVAIFSQNAFGQQQLVTANGKLSDHTTASGFVENKGQLVDQDAKPNDAVRYLLGTDGINIQLRDGGFSYDTYQADNGQEGTVSYHRVDVSFEGANDAAELIADGRSVDYSNFYTANLPEAGVTHVHHYQRVVYREIYRHIDAEFVLTGDLDKPFEYNFIIRPGGQVADIRMRYEGAPVMLKGESLNFSLRQGLMEETIPASWYGSGEGRTPLQATYVQVGPNTFGFNLTIPELAAGRTIVIDPAPVRHWGTYFQGTPTGRPVVFNDLKTDAAGMIYAVGRTRATSNIATAGAHQTVLLSNTSLLSDNAIVVKFDDTGNRVWGTYYGGGNESGQDGTEASAVAIDGAGNVVVGGNTRALNGIATTGAQQELFGGSRDAFLVKFNDDGVRQWGTYYGGSSTEYGMGVVTDSENRIYLSGWTQSSEGIATPGAHKTTLDGRDAFLVQFSAEGVRQWGTYYGGTTGGPNGEQSQSTLAVDAENNVFMAGSTASTNGIATPGAHQEIRASTSVSRDAFLVKFNAAGVRQWGTYYGGVLGSTVDAAVTTDVFGNVYLSGTTTADNGIATPGAHQPAYGGGETDAFLVKFDPNGVRLWGSYYGGDGRENSGSSLERHISLATDHIGKVVYLAGATTSPNGMSTPGAHQEELLATGNAPWQAYLAMFQAEDGSREWGTYYGGGETQGGASGVAVDPVGRIYMSGVTGSSGSAALGTPGVHQETRSGTGVCGYLARFGTITADAGADTTTCLGVATVIGGQPSAYGSDGPFTYQWTPATGLNDATAANPVASPSATTTYTLLATNGMGLTDESSVTVTILPLPTADAGEDGTICQGTSITLNGSGSGNAAIVAYQWSPTTGLNHAQIAAPIASPSVTTVYTLTVTDANGCQHSDDATVTVIPLPPAPQLGGGAAYCFGDAIADLTATGIGSDFTWYSDAALTDLVGTGQTLSPAATVGVQTYHVIETLNGCDGPSASVTVTVNALPTANAGADAEVCLNSSVQLNGSGGVSYVWSPSTGLNQTNVAAPSASPATTTTYQLTVTDINGCTDTDDVTVTVLPLPTANAGDGGTICQGESLTLNGSGGVAYAWSPATGLDAASVAAPVASPAFTTVYTLTVTDGNGCQDTDAVTVTVTPLPTSPALSADAFYCEGDAVAELSATGSGIQWYSNASLTEPLGSGNSLQPFSSIGAFTYYATQTVNGCTGLSANVTVTISPYPVANAGQDVTICQGTSTVLNGSGGISYTWSPSTGLSQTDVAAPVASPDVTTTYTLTASNNGCEGTATVTVTVDPAPGAPSVDGAATYCFGDEVTDLMATGSGGTLNWYSDAALSTLLGTGGSITPFSNAGVFNYFVAETADGCEGPASAITVTVNSLPSAEFSATSEGLDLTFLPAATGLDSYNWQFGDGGSSEDQSPEHTYGEDGTYTVTLTVTDSNGCSATFSQDIAVVGVGIGGLGEALGNVSVFPNPTNGMLHIRFDRVPDRVILQVNDINGRSVIHRQLLSSDQHVLDMGGLAPGVYILVLSSSTGAMGSFRVLRQ